MNNIPVVSNDMDAPLILGLFNDTKFKKIMKCEWEWIWKVTVSDGNVEVLVWYTFYKRNIRIYRQKNDKWI
jgi:hypothetical protein